MKHICEICNQQYDTVEAAEQCELAHKKDDAAKKMQADASAKINDAVNADLQQARSDAEFRTFRKTRYGCMLSD